MYTIDNQEFPCSTSLTMRYIGGKWKAVILIHLIEKKRYNELRKAIPMITERTLSLQLKEMEEHGLINRTVYTNKPPLKVEYELTAFGQTLIPLLEAIAKWGKTTGTTKKEITYTPEETICSILE
ncbi:helix-turn-helix transcriptional regulator [Myroides sp. 1354]|uniref:winged helix-turn-helix transcriptional regulator n=1 Tax=unclassified Myroides TaxID=2642485 RepID=UPI0025754B58|nr:MULTISPECIES: helix-turn-helix domain-containing protein [unclassified Myroides]MDM1045203.1 helix-turn-helix transcriptional regulator [Myroides sp. R163-1]MDM1056085.1 helix-turn-helix transcriptional regulator [Myroides sp. 1354]MDM1069214.1 helix-turn-helix transcriptional regulator [Myroides sp. 1372]